MTLQALGGGEFTLGMIPRQKEAPLYWRSDTHTHTHTHVSIAKYPMEERDIINIGLRVIKHCGMYSKE
jgi:hypothetical protein